jgi:hypothetical protein
VNHKAEYKEPFFMIFPWGKVFGLLCLFLFGACFVYRLSEAGGVHVSRACFVAIVTSVVAGVCSLYPICKSWGRDVYSVLIGVMIGAVVRLLITGVGVAIITFFTATHRSWFIVFLGVYYIAFMVADTWLALWVLKNSELNEQKKVHGNIWDIVG